ncbi:hypothetical protein [Roseateles sp. DXS20W]
MDMRQSFALLAWQRSLHAVAAAGVSAARDGVYIGVAPLWPTGMASSPR